MNSMTKANSVHSTPRRTASKTKPKRSAIKPSTARRDVATVDADLLEMVDKYRIAMREGERLEKVWRELDDRRCETGKNPRGYKAATDQMDRQGRVCEQIEKKIIGTPARTIDGIIAKAQALSLNLVGGESAEDGNDVELGVSIAHDLIALDNGSPLIQPPRRMEFEADVVAAGEKFQALLPEYIDAHFEWARLARAAEAVAVEKYGPSGASNDNWMKPNPGTSPAGKLHSKALHGNGADAASNKMSKVDKKLEVLADEIRSIDTISIAGLRAKALVAIWDYIPPFAGHDGKFDFENDDTTWALLQASAEVAGLGDLLTDVWQRLRLCKNADVGVCRRSRLADQGEAMLGSPLSNHQRPGC
jgi:hypothetical protein